MLARTSLRPSSPDVVFAQHDRRFEDDGPIDVLGGAIDAIDRPHRSAPVPKTFVNPWASSTAVRSLAPSSLGGCWAVGVALIGHSLPSDVYAV